MRVETSKQASVAPTDFETEFARQQQDDALMSDSRALVVIEDSAPKPAPVYREAPFLAHLIATRELAPQTRERRRAEPSVAIAAYRNMSALAS